MPEAVLSVPLAARTPAAAARLAPALRRLADEDGAMRWRPGASSGEAVLSGLGEAHLEALVYRLRSEFRLSLEVGPAAVAYRETIRDTVRHAEPQGSPAPELAFRLSPSADAGVMLACECRGVTPATLSLLQRTLTAGAEAGPVAGFPLTGIRLTLTALAAGPSQHGLADAMLTGFRQVLAMASPVLIEPIMWVEVVAPTVRVAALADDLRRRRGTQISADGSGAMKTIRALVPLANMLGYASSLRQAAGDFGAFEMAFSHYAPVPGPTPPDRASAAVALRA